MGGTTQIAGAIGFLPTVPEQEYRDLESGAINKPGPGQHLTYNDLFTHDPIMMRIKQIVQSLLVDGGVDQTSELYTDLVLPSNVMPGHRWYILAHISNLVWWIRSINESDNNILQGRTFPHANPDEMNQHLEYNRARTEMGLGEACYHVIISTIRPLIGAGIIRLPYINDTTSRPYRELMDLIYQETNGIRAR